MNINVELLEVGKLKCGPSKDPLQLQAKKY